MFLRQSPLAERIARHLNEQGGGTTIFEDTLLIEGPVSPVAPVTPTNHVAVILLPFSSTPMLRSSELIPLIFLECLNSDVTDGTYPVLLPRL